MTNWVNHKVEDLIDYKKGYAFKSSFYDQEGDHLIVRVSDTTENSINIQTCHKIRKEHVIGLDAYMLRHEDVVIATVGSWADNPQSIVGKVIKVPREANGAYLNQNAVRLRAKSKITQDYLYFVLKHKGFSDYLLNSAQGSANQASITLKDIFSYQVLLPPLPEQKAIASVLSSLDDKIDLLHRQNKTLEAMAETLFRQWFIEEAKEDWEELSVSDIAIHVKENVNPSKDPLETFYHFSLPAFDSGQKPTSELGSEILSNKYRVSKNSILVSKLNPRVPRIWLVSNVEDNYVCSTEFQNLKPKVTAHLIFLYSLFSSRDVIDELTMSASGTSGSHQRVKPEDMLNITFRTPSLDYLEQYSSLIAPSMQKVASNKQQIKTLENLRDTLLPKLMSGEVRVQYQTKEVI